MSTPSTQSSARSPACTNPATKARTRLPIDLVPSSSWCSNLRSVLTEDEWGRVSRHTYREAGYRCVVCGGKGPQWPVEAHERWVFDEETGVQILSHIDALCPDCHAATHLGFAMTQGRGEKAIEHLAHVNAWDPARLAAEVEAAFSIWERRSQQAWMLDLRWILGQGFGLCAKTQALIVDLAALCDPALPDNRRRALFSKLMDDRRLTLWMQTNPDPFHAKL